MRAKTLFIVGVWRKQRRVRLVSRLSIYRLWSLTCLIAHN